MMVNSSEKLSSSRKKHVSITDIKDKIEDFIEEKQISLSLFYEYIDKDGDK
jgi:hypothetical protein